MSQVASSNDLIGGYSKFELLTMGLYTSAELSAEPEAVYCVGAQPTYDSGSGTITTFSCSSLNFISASAWDAIVNTNGLIAPLRVSSAVVMPSVQLLL